MSENKDEKRFWQDSVAVLFCLTACTILVWAVGVALMTSSPKIVELSDKADKSVLPILESLRKK